jgi:hypothetical protein
MWKVIGMLVVIFLSIIPGAVCGAIVGAIYAPAKVWALFGDETSNECSTPFEDEI